MGSCLTSPAGKSVAELSLRENRRAGNEGLDAAGMVLTVQVSDLAIALRKKIDLDSTYTPSAVWYKEQNNLTSDVVSVFVSSTFTDTKFERDALIEHVYPELCKFAASLGIEFVPSEMRWGIREETSARHETGNICVAELNRCLRESLGLAYILVLKNKYGYRPFPPIIPVEELDALKRVIQDAEVKGLIEEWFQRDDNFTPPVYFLLPSDRAPSAEYWGVKDKPGVFTRLQQALRTAAAEVLDEERAKLYRVSITEQEAELGLLDHAKSANKVKSFYFETNFVGELPQNNTSNKNVKRYFDCLPNSEGNLDLDQEAASLMQDLKKRVRKVTPAERVKTFEIEWKEHEGGGRHEGNEGFAPEHDEQAHAAYLERFCAKVREICMQSITEAALKRQQMAQNHLLKEIYAHLDLCLAKVQMFEAQAVLLGKISAYLQGGIASDRMLVIHGPSGCGKTSVMAKAAFEASRQPSPNHLHILRFLGTTAKSSDVEALLVSLIAQIEAAFETTPTVDVEGVQQYKLTFLVEKFHECLSFASENHTITIFLDSLDQLSDWAGGRQCKWLPRRLPPHCRLVVSTLPEEGGCLAALQGLLGGEGEAKEHLERVPELSNKDVKDLLDRWLRDENRELAQQQRQVILDMFKRCPLPLYLRLAFIQSRLWRSSTLITAFETLAKDVPSMIQDMLQRIEVDHGQLLVAHALGAMTAAFNGMTVTQMSDFLSLDDEVLEDVYQWWRPPIRRVPPLLWKRVLKELEEFIVIKDIRGNSVYGWYHRQFWQEAQKRYLSPGSSLRVKLHSLLADLFSDRWVRGKPVERGGALVDRRIVPLHGALGHVLGAHRFSGAVGEEKKEEELEWTQLLAQKKEVLPTRLHALSSVLPHLLEAGRQAEAVARVCDPSWLVCYLWSLDPLSLDQQLDPARFQQKQCSAEQVEAITMIQESLRVAREVITAMPMQVHQELLLRLPDDVQDRFVSSSSSPMFLAQAKHLKVPLVPCQIGGQRPLAGGPVVMRLTGHSREINHAVFFDGGNKAMTASSVGPGHVGVWDMKTGENIRMLEGHYNKCTQVDVFPEGKHAISSSWCNRMIVWDLETGGSRHIICPGRMAGVLVVNNGKHIFAATKAGCELIEVTDDIFVSSESEIAYDTLKVSKIDTALVGGAAHHCVKSPLDGGKTVLVPTDKGLGCVSVEHPEQSETVGPTPVAAVSFTLDGTQAVAYGGDGLMVFDVAKRELLFSHKISASLRSIAVCSQDTCLGGHIEGPVVEFDFRSGKQLALARSHCQYTCCVAVGPHGLAITGGDHADAMVWDVSRIRSRNDEQVGHNDQVNLMVVSDDGNLLATSAEDGVCIWDVEKGSLVRRMLTKAKKTYSGAPFGMAFVRDCSSLAITRNTRNMPTKTIPDLGACNIGIYNISDGEPSKMADGQNALLAPGMNKKEIVFYCVNSSLNEHILIGLSRVPEGSNLEFKEDGKWNMEVLVFNVAEDVGVDVALIRSIPLGLHVPKAMGGLLALSQAGLVICNGKLLDLHLDWDQDQWEAQAGKDGKNAKKFYRKGLGSFAGNCDRIKHIAFTAEGEENVAILFSNYKEATTYFGDESKELDHAGELKLDGDLYEGGQQLTIARNAGGAPTIVRTAASTSRTQTKQDLNPTLVIAPGGEEVATISTVVQYGGLARLVYDLRSGGQHAVTLPETAAIDFKSDLSYLLCSGNIVYIATRQGPIFSYKYIR